jgi:signal transduction histidine kinase
LGLCITRGLVTLHGGTIAVISEVAAGTSVTVTFPVDRVIAAPTLFAEAAD